MIGNIDFIFVFEFCFQIRQANVPIDQKRIFYHRRKENDWKSIIFLKS